MKKITDIFAVERSRSPIGVARARFSGEGYSTRAVSNYSQGALRISRLFRQEGFGGQGAYLINPGGGYLQGDFYELEVELGDKALLRLMNQSAMKVYKCPKGSAVQHANLTCSDEATLEYLSEPIILYRGAKLTTQIDIGVHGNGALLYSEIVGPGWAADMQPHSYQSLASTMKVSVDDKLVLFDRLSLGTGEPLEGTSMNSVLLRSYPYLGTLIIAGSRLASKVDHGSLPPQLISPQIGFSNLGSVAIVRGYAKNGSQLTQGFSELAAFALGETSC